MKRAIKTIVSARGKHYFGELERSENPRSEFHTVGNSVQCDTV